VSSLASSIADRLALAEPLLPPGVGIGCVDPLGMILEPMPEEAVCLSPRAVLKRRLEFAAGRLAAREAMGSVGLVPKPVLQAEDRAPIWPSGVVGSITHTRDCAMAVVGRSKAIAGLGLDLEASTPLEGRLLSLICTEGEHEWLLQQHQPGLLAKLMFSAKEAAYKCQYPISRCLFDFDKLNLSIDRHTSTFAAAFTEAQPPFPRGFTLQGRWAIGAGILVTLAILPREALASRPHCSKPFFDL